MKPHSAFKPRPVRRRTPSQECPTTPPYGPSRAGSVKQGRRGAVRRCLRAVTPAEIHRSPEFVRYWKHEYLATGRRSLAQEELGTRASRSSIACAWGCVASTADLVSLILAMMTSRKDPISRSLVGASRREVWSSFRKH